MRKIQSLAAVLLLVGVVSAQEADPAQPAKATKPLAELLKDRAAVQEVLKGMTKSFDDTRKEFSDRKETKEFNAKLQKLQQGFLESDKRLKELNEQIADAAAKDQKK